MDDRTRLDVAASIADPIERARALSALLADLQAETKAAAGARRDAIEEALSSGMTQDQLSKAIGVTPGRISQMRRADAPAPVLTGWRLTEPGPAAAHVALCGSRAPGTNAEQIDAAILSLAELLMRQRYAISHGPVGVGAEVLTYIADHYHPDGLVAVRGIIGHANVIRDAEYVLVVGGGSGTQSEADTAIDAGKRLLPMPTSGGTAARIYMRQLGEPSLRAWLPDATFSALATADAARFAEIAEAATIQGGTDG